MSIETLLNDATRALAAARGDEPKARLAAITKFMSVFDELAQEIARGTASWDDVRAWAGTVNEQVRSARIAIGDWQMELGRLFYSPSGDERDAENALVWRSQHAFLREAFRGTSVDELFAGFEDAEVDQDLHEEAVRLALDPPSYVPPSHTWWRWRNE